MNEINDWTDLKENIETTIYEGILKLGYNENESFSIYYDLDLLNHLLHTNFDSVNAMKDYLVEFTTYIDPFLPGFSSSLLPNNRFKFTVLKDGIHTIHKNNKNNHFLRNIINLVNTKSFNIDDVIEVFKKTGNDFTLEHSDHPEFKYVLYFKDKTADRFKYCFNFDELGSYYHRLLDFSYEQSLHEDHHH